MSQAKRSSRRDYADRLWRYRIRERDRICQMVSQECLGRLEAAHIIPKGAGRFSTRWDIDNGILLCAFHHRIFDGVFDKHAYARNRLGEERWEALKAKAATRWNRDYDEVIGKLKEAAA